MAGPRRADINGSLLNSLITYPRSSPPMAVNVTAVTKTSSTEKMIQRGSRTSITFVISFESTEKLYFNPSMDTL